MKYKLYYSSYDVSGIKQLYLLGQFKLEEDGDFCPFYNDRNMYSLHNIRNIIRLYKSSKYLMCAHTTHFVIQPVISSH